jgi:hypothetical protein
MSKGGVYSRYRINNWSFILRGSFQKFCTLYVSSLKMNLFYKIHLQAFNVISIVLYHGGPTFGQVLCSCQDAFVVDASDYSAHLIRHLLNASEVFPRSSFFNFGNKSKSGGLMSAYAATPFTQYMFIFYKLFYPWF